ncbi:hypothetical protein DSO57_1023050 [Entomophthora muscae]|uniref:Uncharacterized protein n=1 Tax=Entomophthora muscae TaxID=34485 RepID=A0ACC2S4S6_9FUNG|nr:hypothetical protein DSO57_1023050 [Entomophthora muscae]
MPSISLGLVCGVGLVWSIRAGRGRVSVLRRGLWGGLGVGGLWPLFFCLCLLWGFFPLWSSLALAPWSRPPLSGLGEGGVGGFGFGVLGGAGGGLFGWVSSFSAGCGGLRGLPSFFPGAPGFLFGFFWGCFPLFLGAGVFCFILPLSPLGPSCGRPGRPGRPSSFFFPLSFLPPGGSPPGLPVFLLYAIGV